MLIIERRFINNVYAAERASDLYTYLQNAIELEHATIPPYLTALFTLKRGPNRAIEDIIRSVVIEEMLHMTIAANTLNAIGGVPQIDTPGFVPTYPGPLPMHIGGDLIVGLAPFSKSVVQDVFMRIEEPEDPLHFPVALRAAGTEPPEFATIGDFYQAVIDKIGELGDGIFTGDPDRQVVDPQWFPPTQLFPITNVASAQSGLQLIVSQGEGTKLSPLDPSGAFAHYYRFAEIDHGRRLRPNPDIPEGYSYTGAPIRFDPDGVWATPENPKATDYPEGSRSRRMADQFNFSYSKLLNALHHTFNGKPKALDQAMGLMYEVKLVANQTLGTPDPSTGQPTGLPFEYSRVNAEIAA